MRRSGKRSRAARPALATAAALIATAAVLAVAAVPAGTATDGPVRPPRTVDGPGPTPQLPSVHESVLPGTTGPAGRAQPAAAAVATGLRPRTITVDGVRRSYLIAVPAGLDSPAPLVLAFHGLFGNATVFARQSRLVPATAAAHEVLVLPQSEGLGFNDGRFGPTGPRDDAFAMAIIGRLVRRGLVDRARVTVAGFSNGAGMAMEVADAHPHRIAAVVSIDGEMIAGSGAPRPTGPVEAVLVHGTADLIQPWAGRSSWGPDAPAYISEVQTVQAWVRADRCGRRTARRLPGRIGPGAAGPVTVDRWTAGPSGAAVTFYRVLGMQHRWPVGAESRNRSDQLTAIDAAQIIASTASSATREGARTVIV